MTSKSGIYQHERVNMGIKIDFQNCSGFSSSQSAERPQETTSGEHSTMYVVFVLLSHEVVKDIALSGGHLPR